jgi:hypothetical protein
LHTTVEIGAFGIQTVYRNAGPSDKAGFLRQVFCGIFGACLPKVCRFC